MQNIRGAIRIFAILMALCCLYYLSFTWATNGHEAKATKYAKDYAGTKAVLDKAKARAQITGDSMTEVNYIDSVINARERYFLNDSMPSKSVWLWHTYQQCKDKEINLGLDLKGGMNVTMEVSVPEIVKALAGNPNTPEFNNVYNRALQMAQTSNDNFVNLFGKAFAEKNPNGSLSNLFHANMKDKFDFNAPNDKVLTALRKEADDAVDRAKLILEKRVNKFGVAQPNIQILAGSGRILVELPGVKDPERVRKLLQVTANLEFWETYNNEEIIQGFVAANQKLKVMMGLAVDSTSLDSLNKIKADSTKKSDSLKYAGKSKADSLKIAKRDSVIKDSIKKIAAANAPLNNPADTSKAKGKDRNPLFEVMQLMADQKQVFPGPRCGTSALKDTAVAGEYLRRPEIRSIFPSNLRFAWSVKPVKDNQGRDFYELIALKGKPDGRASMSGDVIIDANKQYNQMSGASPEVSMEMNGQGAQEWKRLTGSNIGKAIAIVLDGYVYSYPNVQGEIAGGRSSIMGNFTSREADDLVNVLKTGKLPAPARIVEEVIVGPTLGQEAIKAGIISFLVALVVVLIYMAFYYSRAGMVADVALFVNVFFIMGVLSSLGAVLTLPGIAGVVLTIALSVDANILIFERVREELRSGKGISLAIADGYKHAMSSILDSNLTTLILGIILYAFGTGPVQGFATTLIIGILSSLFCAIFITRLIFDGMLKKNRDIKFSVPATENVLRNKKFDFVGKRIYFYMFSLAIIAVGVVFYFKNQGFNLGVDFSGGRTYTVGFNKDMTADKVRDALAVDFKGASLEVKTAGASNRVKITTNYRINDNDTAVDNQVANKVKDGLTKLSGKNSFKIESSSKVGPSIAKDVVSKSYLVVLVSCLLMFIYILFRFRKWQYGLGAVVALLHDVLIVLSCYVIFDGILPFSLEVDQHFIAAILTVMGYSMTDTVVVFDRIREFLTEKKQELASSDKKGLINYALNATLSRTINTSMITFFVLLAIFIFGGDTIRGFSFALLIGIVIGTYSSLCIATPVVVDFDRRSAEKKA